MEHRRQKNRRTKRDRSDLMSNQIISPRILGYTILRKFKFVLLYMVVTIVIILLSWLSLRTCKHIFLEGDKFNLTTIHITPEPKMGSFINQNNVSIITGLKCGKSIFSYSLSELKTDLLKLPEISSITISRRLPGTIALHIKERTPIAKLISRGVPYLIDSSGYCFRSRIQDPVIAEQLPWIHPLYDHEIVIQAQVHILSDTGLIRALHLIKTWNNHSIKDSIISVTVANYHGLEVVTNSDATLKFGYYDHKRQIEDYATLLQHCSLNTLKIKNANLLPLKNIPVIFDRTLDLTSPSLPNSSSSQKDNKEGDILLILEQS